MWKDKALSSHMPHSPSQKRVGITHLLVPFLPKTCCQLYITDPDEVACELKGTHPCKH